VTSNSYYDWLLHNGYFFVAAQTMVAKFMETFKEFPRAQKPGSFTIDDAMNKMSEVGGSS
jgi:arylsulfatase